MKHYVLGFAFSADKKEIILIEKQKPDWQKGKLNGVGGKVETIEFPTVVGGGHDETFFAMVREFKEETGVDTFVRDWYRFGKMVLHNDISGIPSTIHLFRMFNDCIIGCETTEEEEILRVNTDTCLDVFSCMHNLCILIPLALSSEFTFTVLSDGKNS